MIRGIDHLVIACADPDAAASELESSLGLVCTGGGRHPGRGTWNRIAWLADGSYLELIGVDDRARFEHPIGSPVIRARLDVATDDPPGTAAVLHEQLGLDFWAVADLAVADLGTHVVRLVPRGEMAVPAVVTLAAEVDAPRTV